MKRTKWKHYDYEIDWDRVRWLLEDDEVLHNVVYHAMSAGKNMDEPVNLSVSGGVAVVILGYGCELPKDYEYHPQIVSLMAASLSRNEHEINQKIPSTTKLVLIAGEVEAHRFAAIRSVLSDRHLIFVQRRNTGALTEALGKHLPLKKPEVIDAPFSPLDPPVHAGNGSAAPVANVVKRLTAPHGAISEFVRKEADLSKGSAEEARRLFHIAQERGLQTTVASLAQSISKEKRTRGFGETPQSLMTTQQKALQILDEAIAGFQLVREYVAETEALNIELNRKLDAFKAILK